MTRLPRISGKECVNALQKAGFHVKRQKGSHIVLRRDEPYAQVVVPNHKELDRGTLQAILHQSGITLDDLITLL